METDEVVPEKLSRLHLASSEAVRCGKQGSGSFVRHSREGVNVRL